MRTRRPQQGTSPDGLNFGACFSYALAKATGEPLLFKGGHFARSGITWKSKTTFSSSVRGVPAAPAWGGE